MSSGFGRPIGGPGSSSARLLDRREKDTAPVEPEGRWRCTCCKAEADADQIPMLGAWRVLFGTAPFRIICLQHNCPTNHPQCGWFDAERIDDEQPRTAATTVVHRTGCPLSPCDCGATADVGEPARAVDRAPGLHDPGHGATPRETALTDEDWRLIRWCVLTVSKGFTAGHDGQVAACTLLKKLGEEQPP